MEAPTPSTDRLEAFSDGVFAVAATLLVLNLKVGSGGLAHALAKQWPHYATYVVSFLTIGIIWLNHHAQFHRIDHPDRTLMVINLFLLMFVTLIPFPTGLLADHLNSGPDGHVSPSRTRRSASRCAASSRCTTCIPVARPRAPEPTAAPEDPPGGTPGGPPAPI
jgi:hypothetical protein